MLPRGRLPRAHRTRPRQQCRVQQSRPCHHPQQQLRLHPRRKRSLPGTPRRRLEAHSRQTTASVITPNSQTQPLRSSPHYSGTRQARPQGALAPRTDAPQPSSAQHLLYTQPRDHFRHRLTIPLLDTQTADRTRMGVAWLERLARGRSAGTEIEFLIALPSQGLPDHA